MNEKSVFEKDLDKVFDGLQAESDEREKRLRQLEADIKAISTYLGFIRNLDGQLVHEDSPATKADGERLIEELQKGIDWQPKNKDGEI